MTLLAVGWPTLGYELIRVGLGARSIYCRGLSGGICRFNGIGCAQMIQLVVWWIGFVVNTGPPRGLFPQGCHPQSHSKPKIIPALQLNHSKFSSRIYSSSTNHDDDEQIQSPMKPPPNPEPTDAQPTHPKPHEKMGNLSNKEVRDLIEQDLSPSLIEYQYMLSPETTRKCSYACCKMFNQQRSKTRIDDKSDQPIPLSLLHDEVNIVVKVIPKQYDPSTTMVSSILNDLNMTKANNSLRKALHHTLSQFYNLDQALSEDYLMDRDETIVLLEGPFTPKQANIPLLYDVYESRRAWFVVLDMYNFTLEELIQFNRVLLETGRFMDWNF